MLFYTGKKVEVTDDEFNNVNTGNSHSFTSIMMNKVDDNRVNDVHATHKDHNKGL